MIKFYSRKKHNLNDDMSITISKFDGRLSCVIGINKDATEQYLGGAEFVQAGYDEDYPNRLYFRKSNKEDGYKLVNASLYRDRMTIGGDFVEIVKNFTGQYKLHKDGDYCYIEKQEA